MQKSGGKWEVKRVALRKFNSSRGTEGTWSGGEKTLITGNFSDGKQQE